MKMFEIEAECIVRKMITVEARNINHAEKQFGEGNWKDEIEISLQDWEIISGPKEVK